MRKWIDSSQRLVGVVAGAAVAGSVLAPAGAQMMPFDHQVHQVRVDSGRLDNPGDKYEVVYSQRIDVHGAPWMRLIFDAAELGKGSYIQVWSHEDGEVQPLDAVALDQWQYTSAYFNGAAVTVELVAAPGTKKNRVAVRSVLAGEQPRPPEPGERRVCGAVDSRVLSADARTARLVAITLPVPGCANALPCDPVQGGTCTASIVERALGDNPNERILLSAGHCFDPRVVTMTVAQFEAIPLSVAATCSIRHPPVAKQFAVNQARVRFQNGGVGNDWAAFVCHPNPATGRSVFQEQAASFVIDFNPPAVGTAIRKYGYGAQGPGGGPEPFCQCAPGVAISRFNAVQQTSTGQIRGAVGNALCHDVHDCPGDSGEPLISTATGKIIGIGTAGTCAPRSLNPPCPLGLPDPRNGGTRMMHPGLVAAMGTIAGGDAPASDNCNRATPMSPGSIAFSTRGATTDGPLNCNSMNEIWYTYRSPRAEMVRVSTCGSQYDTVLAVYPAGCPAAGLIVCNDDSCGLQSELTFAAAANTTYLISVGGFMGARGDGTLTLIAGGGAPANDLCANSSPVGEGTFPFSTIGAATDGPGTACGNLMNDVWFNYFATNNGTLTVETCGATAFDTVVALYDACPGPADAHLVCNDDACGVQSRVMFNVMRGTEYKIRVGGFNGASGFGNLTVNFTPANNDCANFIAATNGLNLFSTFGATTDGPAGCNANQDIWFRYTATNTGATTFSLCGGATTWDTVLAVYNSVACPPINQVACNDDFCDRQSQVTFNTTAGTVYTVRLGGFGTDQGPGILYITPNDACANFRAVGNGVFPYSTAGATTDGPGDCGAASDIWFRYTAPAAGLVRFSLCGSNFDTVLGVYNSVACPPVNLLGCNDDFCMRQSQVEVMVAAGTTYSVRVGGFAGATGTGFLSIGPAQPANDDCADATQVFNGVTNYSTSGATTDGLAAALCNFAGDNQVTSDIWFFYFATGTGMLEVHTCANGMYDTKIAAYDLNDMTPCPPTAAPLACNDDNCVLRSRITFAVTQNQAYLLRVGGFNGAAGIGTLTIVPPVLANDDCANFTVANAGFNPYSNINALTTAGLACNVNSDVWLQYTATDTKRIRINTCSSNFDTRLAVYDSVACPPINQVGCNDDACDLQSEVIINGVAGTTYTIQVGGFGFAQGNGLLFIEELACACDTNGNGVVNSQDLFDFLTLLFNDDPLGDFNGDTTVSSQDFFDFLVCFFTMPHGC